MPHQLAHACSMEQQLAHLGTPCVDVCLIALPDGTSSARGPNCVQVSDALA